MKKIENIEIKNFKSIRHQKIEDCRRINVFIGYPNTGKSNILEALSGFSFFQFKNGDIFDFSSLIRVNNYPELFFDGNVSDDILIEINNEIKLQYKILEKQKIGIEIYESGQHIKELLYFPDDWKLNIGTFFKGKIHKNKEGEEERDYKFLLGSSAPPKFYSIKKYHFSSKNLNNQRSNNIYSLAVPDGNNLFDILSVDSQLRGEFSNSLQAYNLGLILNKGSETVQILKPITHDTVFIIPYYQIADTLQRLFFFKAAVETNNDSILLFEEPEAHMFPPYISKFTSDMVNDENNNQYFITTHSPFVLNDLIENASEDLAIYTVEYKKETGETLVHKMSDEEMHEAYQFGYDFFLNIKNFLPQS